MSKLFRSSILLLLLAATPLLAQTYKTLNTPVPSSLPANKIEVTAIFSYTCPHCYRLEPQLEAWAARLPDDVQLVRLPAAFNDQWAHLARAYYIMEALDLTEQAHTTLFDAIHQERVNLGSQRALNQFFERYGVTPEETENLYQSFGVESRLRRDTSRLRAFRVTAVPALVIDGRYIVDAQSAGGFDKMLSVADQLITQVSNSR